MVGILLNLKFRLLMNRVAALKRDPKRGQSAIVAVLVVGFLLYKYGWDAYESVSLSGTLPDPGPIFAQLSFSIVFLWIVLPLAYGGRRDLDVRKFQLLPVRPIALAAGLAGTFILSPGAWLTVAVTVVLASSFPDAAAHLPLLAASGLALVLMCVVTGQVVSTGADLLGRQRHARDLLLLLTFLLTAVPVVLFFLLKSQYTDPAGGAGVAGIFAWVPPAWPGVAMAAAGQGQTGMTLAALGGSLVVISLEVWLWTAIISRAMLAQDSSTLRAGGTGDPFARFARRLTRLASPFTVTGNRRGAVAALELRLLWREPARLPGVIISTIVFGGIFTVIAAALFNLGTAGMAVFGVCSVSFIVVGHRLNEIGIHSSALWMNVVARGRATNDLIGRDLASLIIDLPVLLIALAAIAIYRGEVTYVLPAFIFGAASLVATYAGLRVFNVRMARGEPRSKDTAAGQNRPSPLLNLAAMVTWIMSAAPVFAAAALPAALGAGWLFVATPAAVIYSGALWYASLRWMGQWLDQHQAELLVRIESA
ncbi:MAG: hypothetical protein ABWZ02_09025 [Nakamurella sp.]